jgi:hypothetical protein
MAIKRDPFVTTIDNTAVLQKFQRTCTKIYVQIEWEIPRMGIEIFARFPKTAVHTHVDMKRPMLYGELWMQSLQRDFV